MAKRQWWRLATAGFTALACVLAMTGTAYGYFSGTGNGTAVASVSALAAPTIQSEVAGGGTATVSWSAVSAPVGSVSYYLTRDGGAAGGNCGTVSAPISATSCTDSGVSIGMHSYAVVAVWRTWSTTSASQSVNVTYGPASQLVFTAQPAGAVAGNAFSTQPVVTAKDSFGNVVLDYTGTVALAIKAGTGPGGATLRNCSATLHNGVSSFSGCEIDTAGSGYQLHASDGTLSADSAAFTVVAGAPAKLVFTSAALSGQASASASLGAATVQEQDQYGNPTTAAQTVTLSSNTGGVAVFSATHNGAATTTVAITAGASSASFYYGDTRAGTPTITATAGGLSAATQPQTITAASPTKLVVTSAALNGPASSTASLGPATVQQQDTWGNPASAVSPVTVTLASSSAGVAVFSATQNGAGTTAVTIAGGSSSATFYYGDTRAGTPTVTASAGGLTAGTQPETITAAAASQLIFTTGALSGQASNKANLGPATVQEKDQFGNLSTTTLTVNLSSSSTGGVFSATQNGTAITSVSISGGASTASFYYGDTKAGTPTITAAAGSGLLTVTQSATINPAAASQLAITSAALSGPASSTASLGPATVQQQDQFGNPVKAGSTVAVTLSSNSAGAAVFSATQNGAATTTINITAGNSSASFYYGDTKAATPTITAQSGTLTPATQVETISAGPPSKLWWGNWTIVSGTTAPSPCNPFTCTWTGAGSAHKVDGSVMVTDSFGNEVSNVGAGQTVTLSATYGTVSPTTPLAIPASGPAAASFSYKTKFGTGWSSDTLSASSGSYGSATVSVSR